MDHHYIFAEDGRRIPCTPATARQLDAEMADAKRLLAVERNPRSQRWIEGHIRELAEMRAELC